MKTINCKTHSTSRQPDFHTFVFIVFCCFISAATTWTQIPLHSPVFEALSENGCVACHSENGQSTIWLKFDDSTWMVENAVFLLGEIKPDSRLGPIRSLSIEDMDIIRTFLLIAANPPSIIPKIFQNNYPGIEQSFKKGHLNITVLNVKGQKKTVYFNNWFDLFSIIRSSFKVIFYPHLNSLEIIT